MPCVINGDVFFTSNLEYSDGSWWHPERIYGVREEHKRNVKILEEKKYTGSRKKDSITELHFSTITCHRSVKAILVYFSVC